MNTIESTFTQAQRLQITEWIATVRDLHKVEAAPVEIGSPRFNELLSHFENRTAADYAQFTPEDLGEMYFAHVSTARLPKWPLELPQWASSVKVYGGEYPSLALAYVGKEWPVGVATTCVEQDIKVWVEPEVWDGETHDAGDLEIGEPRVTVVVSGRLRDLELTVASASDLEIALGDALYPLKNS
jgi:hypothetical protein